MDHNLLSRATEADHLATRIAENARAQETDLVEWIFERVPIPEGAHVLELCCGTGSQTIRLIEKVGSQGKVVAVDISRKALQALEDRLSPNVRDRVHFLECNLDTFGQNLEQSGYKAPFFDTIFCAYGLYYSSDALQTLEEARRWLQPGGQIIIVGPFGPNNDPLFRLLEDSGVTIPTYVRFTSQDFMSTQVLPWAARSFESIRLSTLVNRIHWKSAAHILNYWQNSTFYLEERRDAVEAMTSDFFRTHAEFVNEKWIMLARMSNARP